LDCNSELVENAEAKSDDDEHQRHKAAYGLQTIRQSYTKGDPTGSPIVLRIENCRVPKPGSRENNGNDLVRNADALPNYEAGRVWKQNRLQNHEAGRVNNEELLVPKQGGVLRNELARENNELGLVPNTPGLVNNERLLVPKHGGVLPNEPVLENNELGLVPNEGLLVNNEELLENNEELLVLKHRGVLPKYPLHLINLLDSKNDALGRRILSNAD